MAQNEPIEAHIPSARFGELLRRHRLAAGLTQQSLAELAGLSEHGIQKLESGASHPYRDTAARLNRALKLRDQDEARFKLAARPVPRRPPHPLPATWETIPTRLPISATSFVARAGEIERIKDRLRDVRLLTLTGSGGCGKTRLALEVARQLEGDLINGVWLIELAPLADGGLVDQAIASTMGIRGDPGRSVLDLLTDYLRERHVLLILDNCEHLIDACAHVADTLLRSCARVQILATSRELLGVAGESIWRIKSLSVADPQVQADSRGDLAAKVLASESGRLFVDRAQLAVPSFALSPQNACAVAQVCQRLDGIPLAIELAAARLSMLSVEQIAGHLSRGFRLLAGGTRTAARRQQTLQATIEWSYQLLSEAERALVRRFAVFAGGWSLEAADALGADVVRSQEDVFELLSGLMAKSIVEVEGSGDNEPNVVRYRLLETIRQFAEQKLVEAGEAEVIRALHLDWYLNLAEQGMEAMQGAEQQRWFVLLEREHDNLRAALTWSAADPNRSEAFLRLAGLLGRFWMVRGHAGEGIRWLEMALNRSDTTPDFARALALMWRGALEAYNGHPEAACLPLEESVSQARAVGDRRLLSLALRHLSMALQSMGLQARALRLIEEALAVSRELGAKREIAWNLNILGGILASTGQLEAVEALLVEGIAVGRESGDISPVMESTTTLARHYLMQGDLARARRSVYEALALARQLDVQLPIANLLVILGDAASAEQDWETAVDWYRQALSAASLLASRGILAYALRHYAAICAARGDTRRAVCIFAATSATHDFPASTMIETPVGEVDILADARRTLGADEFAVAWTEGQSSTLEQMTGEILSKK